MQWHIRPPFAKPIWKHFLFWKRNFAPWLATGLYSGMTAETNLRRDPKWNLAPRKEVCYGGPIHQLRTSALAECTFVSLSFTYTNKDQEGFWLVGLSLTHQYIQPHLERSKFNRISCFWISFLQTWFFGDRERGSWYLNAASETLVEGKMAFVLVAKQSSIGLIYVAVHHP